jgi:hypothetical protein
MKLENEEKFEEFEEIDPDRTFEDLFNDITQYITEQNAPVEVTEVSAPSKYAFASCTAYSDLVH